MKISTRFSGRMAISFVGLWGGAMFGQDQGIRPGSTEITAFAGLSTPANGEKEKAGLDIKNSTPLGGRISYNFTSHHTVEFSVTNPVAVYANYVYHLSPIRQKWIPYATAGAGGSRYGLELNNETETLNVANANLRENGPDRAQTAFAGNFGGGIKYLLSDRFALRFDARDFVARYSATIAGTPGSSSIKTGRTVNDLQFTAGFVFRFGGR